MRGAKGKLICVWSPVLHGEGCSTLACSIGFSIQYYTGRKVLIVNMSNSTSHMERYVDKDIEIKYSMDNLKIFNTGIRTEHVLTYATEVNKGLYMIAGSRFKKELAKENTDFDKLFLDKSLEAFDIVIADMDTGVREENRLYLERADIIIAAFSPNEIVMDELYEQPGMKEVLGYFKSAKTLSIINKLYDGWESCKVIGRYKGKYALKEVFGLNYDGDVLNACCTERDFYSFLMKEMKRGKNEYVKQLAYICDYLIEELSMEKNCSDGMRDGSLFKRLLQSSIF